MKRGPILFALVGLNLVVSACGLRPASGTEDGSPSPRGRVVESDEIERSSARTAWDALKLLGGFLRLEEDQDQRPARITARGQSSIVLSSEPRVIVDGVRLVEYGVLQRMSAHLIDRIEFLTGPEATTRYGTNAGHGVILITTRTAGQSGGGVLGGRAAVSAARPPRHPRPPLALNQWPDRPRGRAHAGVQTRPDSMGRGCRNSPFSLQ